MSADRLADVCGVIVAFGELVTGIAHAWGGNWRAALVWIFYAVAAGLLAFMR